MWPLTLLLLREEYDLPKPLAVVSPRSIDEVIGVVEASLKTGGCIVPRCGGSSVTGAVFPHKCCIILDLGKLNKIVEFSEEDQVVQVESGVKIIDLEEWLNKRGYMLGFRPQSEKLACIGGAISCLGSGAYRPGIGNIEDSLLWVDVVTPYGILTRLGSRSNPRGFSGPDLKRLFLGSEGGLGVIVAAGFRVRELPEDTRRLSYTFPSFEKALDFARKLVQWVDPILLRIEDSDEARFYYGIDSTVALIEIAGPARVLDVIASEVDSIAQQHSGKRIEELVTRWWEHRLSYNESIELVFSAGFAFDTIDIAATWSKLPRIWRKIRENLLGEKLAYMVMSHVSHFYVNGGVLYFVVVFEREIEKYWAVWSRVVDIVSREGGSIVHHHGYGVLRSRWIEKELGRKQLDILCRVKESLDIRRVFTPHGFMGRCSRIG